MVALRLIRECASFCDVLSLLVYTVQPVLINLKAFKISYAVILRFMFRFEKKLRIDKLCKTPSYLKINNLLAIHKNLQTFLIRHHGS